MWRRVRSFASDYRFRKKFIEGTYANAMPFKTTENELRSTVDQRRRIWQTHSRIHERFAREGLEIVHSKLELALVAESILSSDVDGPVVEFGCYHGLSTAKLSLAAKEAGRRLIVFDSFEGLPEPRADEIDERNASTGSFRWRRHQYRDSLDAVKARVELEGCLEACEFVRGYYDRTLADFNLRPSVVFEDVDLISSMEDVLRACYPRMPSGAVFYSHEAAFPKFVDRFFIDDGFWRQTFQERPPYLVGGLSGLCDGAGALAYFVKKEQ